MKGRTLLLVVSLATSAQAATLHVPADHATIQAALNAAANSDSIRVAPGTYVESLSFAGKTVSLLSEAGAAVTTIRVPDGGSSPVISLSPGSGEGTLIRGFTLHGDDRVRCISSTGSSPTVEECVIEHGYVFRDGGGAFFENGAVLVRNNVFRYNRTDISGGAIFVRLGYGHGTAQVIGNTCYGNQAPNGPGIAMIQGENGRIERNVVYGNATILPSVRRGAVFVWAEQVTVVNNTIADNSLGLTILSSTDVDARNNIIVGHPLGGLELQQDVGPNTNVTYDYNDVWDNGGLDYIAASPAAHDLNVDPEFVDPTGGDFSLDALSPCVDAGDPVTAVPAGGGIRVDLGAIEVIQIYLRGDCDNSGDLGSADIIYLVSYIFKGGPPPVLGLAVGDVNCNGSVAAQDIIWIVNHVFRSMSLPDCP